MTKHGISRERKELFRWKKKALKGMFEGLSFGEKKKKKWYKIADASFNKVFTWRATIP